MSVKIRLRRMGSKKKPFYRIVVADSRSPRDGRFIEILGNYDPKLSKDKITLNEESALSWLHNGAQPSDTVRNLFSREGLMKQYHEEKLANKKK